MNLMQKTKPIKNKDVDCSNSGVLAECVKETLSDYFNQLNGHDTSGLYAMVISEVEKPLIEATLEYCRYNQSKASKLLGMSRSTLRKKIEQYDLS